MAAGNKQRARCRGTDAKVFTEGVYRAPGEIKGGIKEEVGRGFGMFVSREC